MSADQRREQVLEAASDEFALGGYRGASTEAIARRAGISQPYLFRLFGTKKQLFIDWYLHGAERVRGTFESAIEGVPRERRLLAMGLAHGELQADRVQLLGQLQGFAACADPDIREVVRRSLTDLYRFVEQASGADPDAVRAFFAQGMLVNAAAAVGMPEIAHSRRWTASFPES